MDTSGFGHLLSIQHEMAVAAHALWPLVGGILPDGCVVVQAETQMVVDQVLARSLQLQMINLSLKQRTASHTAFTSQDVSVMPR